MNHPQFVAVSSAVNAALADIGARFGFDLARMPHLETQANRAVDDMTALVLRALNFSGGRES
ncbi:hypothetical protein [Bradyrhizobium elkanii]|uniref:hypothetical protein n=1 Tax=Bradyrhizobium elkanii TaxID=29448 RepID=UPI0004841B46|nr:hypothetical protein [Bradyrhizobium elkanii]